MKSSRIRYTEVYSDESEEEEPLIRDEEPNEIAEKVQINDYVVVKFEGRKIIHHYVGLVLSEKDDSELLIKFLRKSAGMMFVFPEMDDICLVNAKDVVAKLNSPSINNRQQYKFCIPGDIMKLL